MELPVPKWLCDGDGVPLRIDNFMFVLKTATHSYPRPAELNCPTAMKSFEQFNVIYFRDIVETIATACNRTPPVETHVSTADCDTQFCATPR